MKAPVVRRRRRVGGVGFYSAALPVPRAEAEGTSGLLCNGSGSTVAISLTAVAAL
jgi:hypothetical protein